MKIFNSVLGLYKNFKENRLLFGMGMSFFATVFNSFGKFIIVFILSTSYTKTEFGLWATVLSATTILGLGADLGLVNAFRNKISEVISLSGGRDVEAKKVFFASFILFWLLSLVLIGIFLLVFFEFSFDFILKTNDTSLQDLGNKVFLWSFILVILSMPLSLGNAALFSFGEANINALLLMVNSVLNLLLIGLIDLIDCDIVYVIISQYFLMMMLNFGGLFVFLRRRAWLSFNGLEKPFEVLKKYFKELLLGGSRFLGLQFAKGFIENAGTIVVSSQVGLNLAADYNLVQKVFSFASGTYQSIFNPLWAEFTLRSSVGDWHWCKKAINRTLLATSIFVSFLTFTFIFAQDFIFEVLKYNSQNITSELLISFGLLTYFYLIFTTVTTFQSAIGRTNFISAIMLIFAVIVLLFAKYFIGYFGMIGVSILFVLVWFLSSSFGLIQSFRIINRNLVQAL
jgi:O-antigen/teichoic acid export membrane protein